MIYWAECASRRLIKKNIYNTSTHKKEPLSKKGKVRALTGRFNKNNMDQMIQLYTSFEVLSAAESH